MIVPFGISSYEHPSLPISAQRCVNLYAEKQPPDAKTPVALLGSPGLVQFASIGDGPIRGMDQMDGVLYAVSGTSLYSVTSSGTGTELGGVISGTGVVSMDNNGSQLIITNGTNGFTYSVAAGFALITDVDFFSANSVVFFDQRFVLDKADSNQFFASEQLDGTSYDPLAIASAETRPDNVKSVTLNQQVLLVFGERSIEPWQDVGAPNFPYERVPGALIERGILAPHAFCKADNTVFFVGDNRILYRLAGLTPQRVSNHAIEQVWQDYDQVDDCHMFAFHWNGHEFVHVTFPSEGATWVYDVATGIPHERESWDEFENNLSRWRGNCHIRCYGKELIGDAYTGKIGYLSNTTYTEYGNVMQGISVSPPIHSDRKRVFMPRFELDVESGVGLTTGQGSSPQIMLDWSDDGGRSYSTRQLWQSIGAMGANRTRVRWRRLGQARNRIMRLTISDPVRRTIMAAHADIYTGT